MTWTKDVIDHFTSQHSCSLEACIGLLAKVFNESYSNTCTLTRSISQLKIESLLSNALPDWDGFHSVSLLLLCRRSCMTFFTMLACEECCANTDNERSFMSINRLSVWCVQLTCQVNSRCLSLKCIVQSAVIGGPTLIGSVTTRVSKSTASSTIPWNSSILTASQSLICFLNSSNGH